MDALLHGREAGQDESASAERRVEGARGEQGPILQRVEPRAESTALAGVMRGAIRGEESHGSLLSE
jgi:hypothetical protein